MARASVNVAVRALAAAMPYESVQFFIFAGGGRVCWYCLHKAGENEIVLSGEGCPFHPANARLCGVSWRRCAL